MPNISADRLLAHSQMSAKEYRVLFATTVDELLRLANFAIGSIYAMVSGPIVAAILCLQPSEEFRKVVR